MSQENPIISNEEGASDRKELLILSAASNVKNIAERLEHTFSSTTLRIEDSKEYQDMRIEKLHELEEAVKKLRETLGL